MKHRSTGNPRGRPPCVSEDIYKWILDDYKARVNPETGLILPQNSELARKFHVSRSTLCRRIADLRRDGYLAIVYVKEAPDIYQIYYRLLR